MDGLYFGGTKIEVIKINIPKSVYVSRLNIHEGDILEVRCWLGTWRHYATCVRIVNISTGNNETIGCTQDELFGKIYNAFNFVQTPKYESLQDDLK